MAPPTPTRFFNRQANARRRTLLLLVYFPLAILFVIAAINGIYILSTIFTMEWIYADQPALSPYRDSRMQLVNFAAIALILGGSLYKLRQLSKGGRVVAEAMGAVRVEPGSANVDQRRLINVVEEMAIASRLPVPGIYILEGHQGINAFAAGFTPRDAVVVVTDGALELLTRDELQGVMAHEIAHIVNGDMRLNTRMIGLLHGIQLVSILGSRMVESAAKGVMGEPLGVRDLPAKSPQVMIGLIIFGYLIWFFGYIGLFFSQLVQSAVSRQREHLADASAVQFTRNPEGLARALMKIGGLSAGSRVHAARAREASHLFFGDIRPRSFVSWTATHPPLEQRVRLLDPSFDGQFPKLLSGEWYGPQSRPGVWPGKDQKNKAKAGPDTLEMAAMVGGLAVARQLLLSLPRPLLRRVHNPPAARGMIYALLMDHTPKVRREQLALIAGAEGDQRSAEVDQLAQKLVGISQEGRMVMADLAPTALANLPQAERDRVRGVVKKLIHADQKVTLFEYTLEKILDRTLAPSIFQDPLPSRRLYSFRRVGEQVAVLLSVMARLKGRKGEAPEQGFATGLERLGGYLPLTLLPRERCTLAEVDQALEQLLALGNEFRVTLVEALASTALEGEAPPNIRQIYLMRAICAYLDCPFPHRLVEGAPPTPVVENTPPPASSAEKSSSPASTAEKVSPSAT
ncbi:MAG: M48 family metallopeptidase [Magnetococcales bacterium]|nr:M48 family metallopeptidase [Magnetococcales bacterium]